MAGAVSQAWGPSILSATLSKSWSTVRAAAVSGALAVVGVPTAPSRSSRAPIRKKFRHVPFSAP
jgi:hypothetical protein